MSELSLVERICQAVGADRVLTRPGDVAGYYRDWLGRTEGRARCVVLPRSTQEVAAVVRLCAEAGEPVVPQGGNTGVCGGAVPSADGRGIVLSLSRLNAIRRLDVEEDVLVAEAGCVLLDLKRRAEAADRLLPLSLGAEGSCQIGGNVSTNAGGIAAIRYGSARDLVLGLEVVLPDGRIWDGLRRLRKDNAGYRLKDLFIGAEGTLGVVTAVALKLFAAPVSSRLAWCAADSVEAAIALLQRCRRRFREDLAAFELMSGPLLRLVCARLGQTPPFEAAGDWTVLVHLASGADAATLEAGFVETLAEAMEAGEIRDAVVARSGREEEAFWRLRHGVTEANRAHGLNVTHDIALPVSRAASFFRQADAMVAAEFPGADVFSVSHLGDGNIHYTVTIPHARLAEAGDRADLQARITARVHELAMAMEGTFTAEHGIGQRYRASLARYKSEVELDLFRRLKAAFDPQGLMNPGKLLPPADGENAPHG
ncbi:MAG: FAD-binding oxidoreductase [Mesorhizobium sp.]|nr:FAD-binding oxidoreductase [Mesorhizobium sp.]MBN9244306.1 FAD-binding oxidoreductase [Mesorhizobium sp.]